MLVVYRAWGSVRREREVVTVVRAEIGNPEVIAGSV